MIWLNDGCIIFGGNRLFMFFFVPSYSYPIWLKVYSPKDYYVQYYANAPQDSKPLIEMHIIFIQLADFYKIKLN